MRAAIYARRSTEEHQVASLDIQIEEATRYIASKGWSLDDEHVFIDSGVSRAEFKKRPGIRALLLAKEQRAVDVIVARDDSRIGGDTILSPQLVMQLTAGGTRLFYYFADKEVRLKTAVDKLMMSVSSFGSESEREKISERTREHLSVKARRGFVAGGVVYGYRNLEIKEGYTRVRVEYAIDENQASIVREIFERYVAGAGAKSIAKDLNRRLVPAPRAGKRGTGSWTPTSIRPMLQNERYKGVLVWGRVKKSYEDGTKVRTQTPEDQWTRVDAPHLRIISDELWAAARKRERSKVAMGRSRPSGAKPKYLLSGLSRCGICGGPIQVANGKASHEPIN